MSFVAQNLSKNTGRYVENTNKKVVFFFSSSKNKYYFIILIIILSIFLGGLFWVKISSNGSPKIYDSRLGYDHAMPFYRYGTQIYPHKT